jgi:ABC-type dipeptide/oligopeptide/nickel transport system permease subunit
VFDAVFSRLIDAVLAFPTIILALGIVAVTGPGLDSLILAVGIRSVPVFARVARAQTLAMRDQDFVQAALALGSSAARILVRHIFPNIAHSLFIVATLQVATAILIGSTLTFLGVGLSAELPEWGAMLNAGRPHMMRVPQLVLLPGVTLMLVMMAFNVLGDFLRDRFDPHMQHDRP